MKTDEKKKNRKINFEVKRVYVGKKPIGEVFEEVIEHIVEFLIIGMRVDAK